MAEAVVAVGAFIGGAVTTAAGAAGLGFSSSTAIAIGTTAVKVAAAAAKFALLAGANAVIANQNKPEPQGQLINLAISPNEPRRLIIGKRMTGGLLVDWMINGSKNQYLYTVTYLCEGPINRLTKVFSGGREVYSIPLVHGVRTEIPAFSISGGPRLYLTFYDGRTGQAADPRLMSEFPGQWNANKRGTGMAYVVSEIWYDSDIQTRPPTLSYEVEGALLYDRRLDTTAGGSGAHRFDNPSTWQYSTNPMVALDHYILGRYLGAVKTFGLGLPSQDFPFADFVPIANLCDELVALKAGGTQRRYEANGYLFADRSFKDTIMDLCRAMDARAADFGGRIGVLDNQPRSPVMEITEADVIEGSREQYRPKSSYVELFNGVTGTFINPDQNYQPTDFPRITDATWQAQDGGQMKLDTIDFEMEVSQERAERLASNYIARRRRQARLSGTYRLRTIQLEQGDWFIRSGGRFGAGKTFEVMDRVFDPVSKTVTIAAFEVDPADTAWDETEAADLITYPSPDTPAQEALPLPDMTLNSFSFSLGTLTFPAFRFVNNDAADAVAYGVNIEYGLYSGSGGTPDGEVFTHFMPPGMAQSTVYGLFPDRLYLVRYQNVLGDRRSAWTAWAPFSTSVLYTGGEASAIDWNAVYGTGRPADFADVTASNIAAGFTGQGAFATVDTIDATLANNNDLMRRSFGGLFVGDLAADITASNIAAGFSGQGALATLGAANWQTQVTGTGKPVNFADVTGSNVSAGISGQGALATLNAANWASQVTGSGKPVNFADVTSANIAAGFSGQGALAVLNAVTWATQIVGAGKPTDNADVTGSNIAAGFSGQGALATANNYNQEADPGAVPNSSLWYQPSTQSFFVRNAGAWVKVSDITPAGAGPQPGAQITTNPVYAGLDGTNRTTSAAALTLTGLTGTITYLWQVTSAGDSDIVVTTPGGATSAFRWPSMAGDRLVGIACLVTANEGSFLASGVARWTSFS